LDSDEKNIFETSCPDVGLIDS